MGETNSTTSGREEATLKKVRSVEMQYGREKDHARMVGLELWLPERARDTRMQRNAAQEENESP